MTLPNFNRPALPYTPEKLPFYNRYSSLGKSPPSADQFDADINALIDISNILGTAINETAAGILPGSNESINANRLATTDGAGNVFWTLINPLNLDINAVQTQHIKDGVVTTSKIQAAAVSSTQIANNAVTSAKIADSAVTANKIASGSVQLSKMLSSGHSSFIIGDNANYSYKELSVEANYYVPTRIANETKPSMQPISVVWNSSVNASCSISKLMTDAIGGFVISGAGNASIEILPVLDTDYWKLPVRTLESGGKVTLKTLAEIAVNSPFTDNTINGSKLVDNTVSGSKVTDGSLPKTKLQNSGQVAPFAMGYIAANGSAQKVFNCTSSRLSLGLYKIDLSTVAPDTKYIVTFGNEDNGGNYVTNAYVVSGSRTTSSFNVQVWGSAAAAQDEGFNFVVYAF